MTNGIFGVEFDPFRVESLSGRVPVALPPAIEFVPCGDMRDGIEFVASRTYSRFN